MTHNIYVASSWKNVYQPEIVIFLRGAGHTVYDFRQPTPGDDGFHWSEIDTDWENWDADSYRRALVKSPLAAHGYNTDMNALEKADVVVLLQPCGDSAHSEAAYHRGKGKPVIIHIPGNFRPELMHKMFNAISQDTPELLTLLNNDLHALQTLNLNGPAT